MYAIELLAGTRPGEAAALRWRHYDSMKKPLGKLLVAKSYSARADREKSTKTHAVKHVPVSDACDCPRRVEDHRLGNDGVRREPVAASGVACHKSINETMLYVHLANTTGAICPK